MKVFLLKQARAWEEFYFTFLSFTFVRYFFSPLAQCLSTCVPPVVPWDNGLLKPWGMRQGGDRTLSISLASEHLHSLRWIIPTTSISTFTLMWKILGSSPFAQYQWLLRYWLAPNKGEPQSTHRSRYLIYLHPALHKCLPNKMQSNVK